MASLPGKNPVERNKTMVIENVLPSNLEDKLSMYKEDIQVTKIKDINDILIKLEKLKVALEEMEVDMADEILDYLKQFEYEEEVSLLFEKLAIKVLNLESDNAVKIIEQIKDRLN